MKMKSKISAFNFNWLLYLFQFTLIISFIYGTSLFSKTEEIRKVSKERIFFLTHNSIFLSIIAAILYVVRKTVENYTAVKNEVSLADTIDVFFLNKILEFIEKVSLEVTIVTHAINTLVFVVFWTLYAINKNLVVISYPGLDETHNTTFFTNICEHLTPFIFTFTLICQKTNYQRNSSIQTKLLFSITIYYTLILLLHQKLYDGYPYPVLNELHEYCCYLLVPAALLVCQLLAKVYYELNQFLRTKVYKYKC